MKIKYQLAAAATVSLIASNAMAVAPSFEGVFEPAGHAFSQGAVKTADLAFLVASTDGRFKPGSFGHEQGHHGFAYTGALQNWVVELRQSPTGLSGLSLPDVSKAMPMTAVSPVPEPGVLSLLVAGLGAVGFAIRRRKQG